MSLIYTMETFILPRSFLMMHSSSISFQKTHLFHAGSYVLEFILLVLLLSGVAIYGYLSLRQNVKRTKSNVETRKSHSPSPKVLAKIKEATAAAAASSSVGKLVAEKSSLKVATATAMGTASTAPSKKRTSSNSPHKPATASPSKKKAGARLTCLQNSRLKNDSQRNSFSDGEKVCVRENTNTKCKDNGAGEQAVIETIHAPVVSLSPVVESTTRDVSAERPTSGKSSKSRSRNARRRQRNQSSQPVANDSDDLEQLYQPLMYFIPHVEPVPVYVPICLSWYTAEEEDLYSLMGNLLTPHNELASHGYPFMVFRYPNYAAFYNSTPGEFRFWSQGCKNFAKDTHFALLNRTLADEALNQYFANDSVRDGRECCRCRKKFFVSENENCFYHSGRLRHEYLDPSKSYYPCCNMPKNSPGCVSASDHVWNGLIPGVNGPIDGFVITEPSCYPMTKHRVVAIDCEMCFTIKGLELTRVTMLNIRGEVIYDTLVMPENPIIDYNTSFSGITKECMEQPGATKSLKEVQQDILQLIDSSTIVIGHGLENDFRALKLVHYIVIDTAITFSSEKRYSLKNLTHWYLRRTIQENETGHDSVEDALACLDLVKHYIRVKTGSKL